jgi:hypothetical protein
VSLSVSFELHLLQVAIAKRLISLGPKVILILRTHALYQSKALLYVLLGLAFVRSPFVFWCFSIAHAKSSYNQCSSATMIGVTVYINVKVPYKCESSLPFPSTFSHTLRSSVHRDPRPTCPWGNWMCARERNRQSGTPNHFLGALLRVGDL